MKNLAFLPFFILFAHFTHAQETESTHSFVLGGSVSFSTQTNAYPFTLISLPGGGIFNGGLDNSKNTSFSFAPYIGMQQSDRLMGGIDLHYQIRQSASTSVFFILGQLDTLDFKQDANVAGVGVFARFFLMPENRFDFFLEPYAQFFIVNEKEYIDDELNSEEKANYISVGSDIGVLYNLNDRWRAILRIGGLRYVNGSWEEDETGDGNDFSSFALNLSLASLGLGVELKL